MTETEIQKAGAISFLKMLDAVSDPNERIRIVTAALFNDGVNVKLNPKCHFVLNGTDGNNGMAARVIGTAPDIIYLFCKAFSAAEPMLHLVEESVLVFKEAKKEGVFNKN